MRQGTSSATILTRKAETETVALDGELVVLDHDRQEYYGLAGAASDLWQTLASGPRTCSEVVEGWRAAYVNPSDQIDALLRDAIAQLTAANLLIQQPDA